MKDQILFEDDRAAKFEENISGWVSRNGLFFGNNENSEHLARTQGRTHKVCPSCNINVIEKHFLQCSDCIDEKVRKNYLNLKSVNYDDMDNNLIYSETLNIYFSSIEDLYDYLEKDYDLNIATFDEYDLMLKPVKQVELPTIHYNDILLNYLEFSDINYDLFEDFKLPDDINNKISEINSLLGPLNTNIYEPLDLRFNKFLDVSCLLNN